MIRFLDYRSPAGTNLIAEWYCGVSVEARAMFDALLEVLAKKAEWKHPEFGRRMGSAKFAGNAMGSNIG